MTLHDLLPGGNSNHQETIADQYDAADWDSEDSGVVNAGVNFEDERIKVDYEFEDTLLNVHTYKDEGVKLVFEDRSSEHWRGGYVSVDADEADRLAAQLELAAKLLRNGKTADIRV